MSIRASKRIAAVTLALLAAAQLSGCNSDDKPSNNPPPGDTGGVGGGNGGGNPGGGTGGGDTGGGDTGGGDTGGGDTGGGDNGGGDNGGGTPGPLAEGIFVDAVVAGLNYQTSSSLSGVTDAEGRYQYRIGDTVTFSIGDLELGTVVAQGVVTPKTVAEAVTANNPANAETVAVNLLVLLQSLDADGNPDNGITFTSEIREAVDANAIDVTADASSFMASLGTFVTTVSQDADVTLTTVTREEAVAHFTNNGPTALAGSYVLANANFEPITQKAVTLQIFRTNRYLMGGQYDRTDCNLEDGRTPKTPIAFSDTNGNGVEHGRYSWDPMTNAFNVTSMIVETDGYCGLNEPDTESTNDITVLEPNAKGLVFKDSDGNIVYRFARLQRETTTIAGPWLAPTSLLTNQPFMFTFFPSSEDGLNGRYLMVDSSFPDAEYDVSPGIEEGCYSIDANDNLSIELNASVCTDAIDTNDTAGASNTDSLQLYIDENDRLVIADGEDVTGFTRLPSRIVTHESLAGSWIAEDGSGVPLANQPRLAMLTMFDDGRFMFGTQEDDASCVPVEYPTRPLAPNGNGVEYGELSLTDAPGLVVPKNVTVDTNGECGLFHDGKTHGNGAPFTQMYLVAPNDAGDALVVWPNDEEDPAGIVFKRVPSETNKLTGAWLWEEGEDSFAIVAYLPGGVMFEASVIADSIGLRRESFTDDGGILESTNAGYEYCLDTQSEYSECLNEPGETYTESYTVDGDVLTFIDEEEGEEYNLTRVK